MEEAGSLQAFDQSTSLGEDECHILGQCTRNNRTFEYTFFTTNDPYCETDQDQRIQALSFDSMRHEVRSARTPRACDIDKESSLQRMEEASCIGRIQLNPRAFVAVPDLRKGVPEPDVESMLQQGSYQAPRRACDKDAHENDPFTPLLPCVEKWVSQRAAVTDNAVARPGMPTRHDENVQQFLADSGYEQDTKGVWSKRRCGEKTLRTLPHGPGPMQANLQPYDVNDAYEVY